MWRRTQVTPRDYEWAGKSGPSASAERDATALEGAVLPGFIRQVDEGVLDHRDLRMQTHDLVAVWLDSASHATSPFQ
jgi:hypothetical protein